MGDCCGEYAGTRISSRDGDKDDGKDVGLLYRDEGEAASLSTGVSSGSYTYVPHNSCS
jgi:hypothetical protein